MEETATTQYIFAPLYGILHIPRIPGLSVCGISVSCPGQQRRMDDYRVITGKPENQITMICSECERIVSGAPEHEIDWKQFHTRGFMNVMP